MTIREIKRMFRWFVRRDVVRHALDDEMDAHIEMAAQSHIREGMDPEEARRRAEREFGGRTYVREQMSDVHALPIGVLVDGWLHDLRSAARSLRHSPSFSLAVIGVFTLAISANATVVGLIDRLMLRPPSGIRHSAELARVYVVDPSRRNGEFSRGMSYLRYTELRDDAAESIDLASLSEVNVIVGEGMNAERLRAHIVSANYFDVLGVHPRLGRFFSHEEAAPPTGADVIVLSYGTWQRMFAGADSVLGQALRLGARRFTVIGIAPREFNGLDLDAVGVWLPAPAIRTVNTWLSPNWHREHNFAWLETVGRVRVGKSMEMAEQMLQRSYASSLTRARPQDSVAARLQLAPVQLERGPNRTELSRVAAWLAAVSLVMLIIAAANVANLFLTRGINRRRELSVRLALGVSRRRLVTQLLAEGAMLAAVSGALAIIATWWGSKLVIALVAPDASAVGLIDVRMLLVTFAAATIAGFAGSLVPVVQTTRLDLAESMRSGARAGTYQRLRLRSWLLATQAALSVVLLVGAGLFVRSLQNAQHARVGFKPEGLLVVDFSARGEQIAGGSSALYMQFLERVRGMPNVDAASRAMSIPFGAGYQSDFAIPGVDSVSNRGDVHFSSVDPSYFAALGTRIIEGRGFDSTDVSGAPLVALVSESMARVFWPGERAIGQCVKVGGDSLPCSTVIGVVENAHRAGVRPESSHQYFVTTAQSHPNTGVSSLVLRVSGDPVAMAAHIRKELQSMAPGAVYVRVAHMRDRVEPTLRPWRLGAMAFVVLGLLALIVAGMGLASVISNVVAQRRHEFGVRLALGAQGRDVIRSAMREGTPATFAGLFAGLAVSAYGTRWMGDVLFDVDPLDAMVFTGVVVVLAVAAIVASLIPAARAMRIDPAIALRDE